MYSPDTLHRLNEEQAIKEYQQEIEDGERGCDFCSKPAVHIVPVYNPADAVREPPVEGAYVIDCLCEECYEEGLHEQERFYCPDCGKLFIYNHSWDVVAVHIDDECFCQECAANRIEPVTARELIQSLKKERTSGWVRINSIPGKREIWSGEFSQYSDFPGHTGFQSIVQELKAALKRKRIRMSDLVYPCITRGYQFSVVLGVFA